MTGVNICDTEKEMEIIFDDLENNPDFSFLGHFSSIQDIYEELNNQGFSDEQIEQMSKNNYGNCLEIIEYASYYSAFIGNR